MPSRLEQKNRRVQAIAGVVKARDHPTPRRTIGGDCQSLVLLGITAGANLLGVAAPVLATIRN